MGQIIRTTVNTKNMVTGNNPLLKPTTTATYSPTVSKYTAPAVKTVSANQQSYLNNLASNGSAGEQVWAKANGGVPTANTPTPLAELPPAELPPVETPTQTPIDTTATLDQLKQSQIAAAVAALNKARDGSLSNLDNEAAGLGQTYYDQRNQAAANSDISAMNFAQRAATRGIQGNAASMPEIYQQNALQGQLGALGQQEASARAGIESNKTNVLNNYQNDLVSAQAGAESQYLQNYIDQMNSDRQFGIQEAGVTGSYKGETTLAGQNQQNQNTIDELTIAAKTIENSYLPQTLKDQATLLQQQVALGKIAPATALAELNRIKAETANVGASTALGWKNLAQNKTEFGAKQTSDAYNNAINGIDNLYVSKDPTTGANTVNKSGLRNYILSLNLPDAQTTQLIQRYGVKEGHYGNI